MSLAMCLFLLAVLALAWVWANLDDNDNHLQGA
jgi:hypothetical protein